MRDIIAEIKNNVRPLNRNIILPETWDPRTLHAAAIITAEDFTPVTLIGKIDEIHKTAVEANVNIKIENLDIIDPDKAIEEFGFIDKFVELRKHKGMTPDKAAEILKNPLYIAAMLVKEGKGHGYVAGADNSTANVLRSALHVLKTKPGIRTLSSSFIMAVPDCEFGADGLFIFADCAVVPNPNAEQLADIAIASAKTCKALLGVEPIVGMLSFSTKGSGKDAIVDKVVEATKIVKAREPDLKVEGELQADAAIIPAIGAKKAPDSLFAGKANTLIFPDLNVGNICYKLVERLGKAGAYGPVIQGCGQPVNDLSRGCSVEDIVSVTAITASSE